MQQGLSHQQAAARLRQDGYNELPSAKPQTWDGRPGWPTIQEKGRVPGAWWLTPIGILNHTVLANDDNGDRDAAIIFGSLLLTMVTFPFIPYLNQLPDKLKVYKLLWRGSSSKS